MFHSDMLLKTIIEFLRHFLPAVGLWIIVFRSPLVNHLLEVLSTKTPMTSDDVDMWLANRGRFKLLTLRNCIWCQAFWTTVVAVLSYCVASLLRGESVSVFALPVQVLTVYPFTCFILWKLSPQ